MSNDVDIDKALATAPTHAPSGRELSKWERAINSTEERFAKVAGEGALVSFEREALFAMQHLTKANFTAEIAAKNPRSVYLAMTNVAATGLTLNPAYGLAYLVPRNGAIVLDISYKGLLQIATDTGSIAWGRAEVVYETDSFEYAGPAAAPIHRGNVFAKDRGAIIGAYCIAKTADGDILTEVMTMEQIETVRGASESWKRGEVGKKGPWEAYFSEMCRKAVIKRAQKTWPRTDRSQRLAHAVDVASDAEGGYTFEHHDANPIPQTLIGDSRQDECNEAAEQYSEAVQAIKAAIFKEDWQEMSDVWAMIPMAAQMALNLAPSKGGIFSTHERKCIKEKQQRRTLPADSQPYRPYEGPTESFYGDK